MNLDLIPYKTMPIWTASTLPAPFQKMHNTKGPLLFMNSMKKEMFFLSICLQKSPTFPLLNLKLGTGSLLLAMT